MVEKLKKKKCNHCKEFKNTVYFGFCDTCRPKIDKLRRERKANQLKREYEQRKMDFNKETLNKYPAIFEVSK